MRSRTRANANMAQIPTRSRSEGARMDSRFARSDRPADLGPPRGTLERRAGEHARRVHARGELQGADGIELDAQLCASGRSGRLPRHLAGSRVSGTPGLLAEAPWSALLQARSRRAQKGPAGQARADPAALGGARCRTPRSLLVNIEIKCERPDDRGLTAEVIRAVRDAGAEERVLLSSFNPLCLARARSLGPALAPRAALRTRRRSGPFAPPRAHPSSA